MCVYASVHILKTAASCNFVMQSEQTLIQTKDSPPKMECGCLHGGVIENSHTHNPLSLTQLTVPVLVRVWVHILGDRWINHLFLTPSQP